MYWTCEDTHLAGENVAKGTKGVIECLVVDRLVEVLDEDVADTRTTKGRITLGPHNTTWTSLDVIEIHGVQCTLGCEKGRKSIYIVLEQTIAYRQPLAGS